MNKFTRITLIPVLAVLLAGLIGSSAALAAHPADLHLEVDEYNFGPTPEPFSASGTAVSAGVICPSGTVADAENQVRGSFTSPQRSIYALKHFVCGDSSGTFDIALYILLDVSSGETTARWRVVSGTGDYAGLRASGSLVGTPIVLGSSIHDVYDGLVH